MELINIYLKKCIDYFMGETDSMTIIKFNTFDFSETLEYIFKYSHLMHKFMRDPVFLHRLETLFNHFYTFCMNHNEFSRLNESIVLTILESYSCVMIMLKHQKIYLYFIDRFEQKEFYQDLVLNFFLFINSLKKNSIQTLRSFYLMRNSLQAIKRHLYFMEMFENRINLDFNIDIVKESLFFINKFLSDKTISSNILLQYYETSKVILDCLSCYLSSKI